MKGWVQLTCMHVETWFQVRNIVAVRANGRASQVIDVSAGQDASNFWDVAQPLAEVLLRIEAAGVIK